MADSFEYTFEDAKVFAGRMAAAPKIVEEEMVIATDRLTGLGTEWAMDKLTANDSVASGELRRSMPAGIQKATFAGGVSRGAFGPVKDYAAAVENGREAVVATGKALVFKPHPKYGIPVQKKGKFAGMAVYKRVKAAKAKPFMKPTAKRLQPEVRNSFRGAMQRVIRRVSGG